MIMIADGSAADGNEHVDIICARDNGLNSVDTIRRDAKVHSFAAPAVYQRA